MRYVKTKNLKPGMTVALGIKCLNGNWLINQGIKLSDNIINRLKKDGYQGIFIADDCVVNLELDTRFNAYNYLLDEDLLTKHDILNLYRIAINIVDDIVRFSPEKISILNVFSFEEALMYHSINTTIYSVLIGKELGLDRNGLYLLAKAAIIHDLGMAEIPRETREKSECITLSEQQIIKNHVNLAVRYLSSINEKKLIIDAVASHHENENGSGYPDGLAGKEIPDFAKIIHVADALDDMTTGKRNRDAYLTADVFDYLTSGIGILFHKAVVNAALKKFDAYPIGAEVVLSNDKAAVVTGRTKDNMRPIITLLKTGETVNMLLDNDYKYVTIKSSELKSIENIIKDVKKLEEQTGALRTGGKTDGKAKQSVFEKKTIVVVDDVFVCRKTVENALCRDFNVVCFERADEALEFIRANDTALVVMDIEMPSMDGVTAVKILRKEGKIDLPVIYLTTVNDRKTIVECVGTNAKDYILKPIKPIYVYERVKEALMGR